MRKFFNNNKDNMMENVIEHNGLKYWFNGSPAVVQHGHIQLKPTFIDLF